MGKKGTPELLYKASRDGFSSEVLWEKYLNQNETITLVQTNLNSVIGAYNPDRWEDTTGKKDRVWEDYKDIVSGKAFLFYWVDDQIQILKSDFPWQEMKSNKNYLMCIDNAFQISAN